jgi:hypothetical protein
MDNLNVLVEAKKEYLGQLCLIMCPPMIEVFDEMYRESVKISKGRKILIMFQKLLKEVPNWSNAMSKQHTDNIADRCAWFNDLLAAVFVACTKILSAVRLKADNKKISLKLPTNEVFIQTCYNNIAKDLYKDPYIFHSEQSEYTRDENLTIRFCSAIENTVKELIPVQQILQTYMSQESRDIDLDGEIEDTIDPDVVDELDTPMEEPMKSPSKSPRRLHQSRGENSRKCMVSRMSSRLFQVFIRNPSPIPNPNPSSNHDHNLRVKMKMFYLVTHQSSVQKNLPIIKWSHCQNISVTHSVQLLSRV